jgi:hypothetical protein
MLLLELRKQKLGFVGLAAAFVVTIPLARLGAAFGHVDQRAAIDAMFLFWTLVGLPAAAALLGAAAGAGLRAEPAAAAESVLPVPPARRAAAALAAAAVQLAALAALILLIALAVSPGWRTTFTETVWAAPEFQRAFFRLLAFSLSYILALSFLCAYGLGHGLAGGLLGLGLAGIGSTALAAATGLQALYDQRDLFRPATALLVQGLCLGGVGYGLGRLSSRLERRAGLGWKDLILGGLGACSGAPLCVLVMAAVFGCVEHRPQPIRRIEFFSDARRLALRLVPGLRKADAQGLLVSDLDGKLLLLKPDGSRLVLVPGEPIPIKDMFELPLFERFYSAEWDADGTLWTMHSSPRQGALTRTLMHGQPGQRFTVLPFKSDGGWELAHRGSQVGVVGWASDGKQRFTPVGVERAASARPAGGTIADLFAEGWAEQGLAAAAGRDGKSISWRGRTWRLPGRVVGGIMSELSLVPAVTPDPSPVFAVNVAGKDGGVSLVLCRPGAKAEQPWPGVDFHTEGLTSDGTLWGWKGNLGLLLIRPDGSAPPILDVSVALAALPKARRDEKEGYARFPVLLRVGDGEAWVLLRGRWLARVDTRTGALKDSWRLPARPISGKYSVTPVAQGFFLHDGERTWFVDWDGKARMLI